MSRVPLLLTVLLSACTLGRVTWGGDAQSGAVVEFRDCDGNTWQTTTSTAGYYVFDGYEDSADTIPDGVYLMSADLASGPKRYEIANVEMEPCPAPHADLLCSRHDVDFGWRPLSGWEFGVFYDALDAHNDITTYTFHHEMCRWLRD